MQKFEVCEKFISINGEGKKAGQLSVFIRFKTCNLSCSYCDTKWANKDDANCDVMTTDEIIAYIMKSRIKNITLTGGEPLGRNGMVELLFDLKNLRMQKSNHSDLGSKQDKFYIEIETNGAVNLEPFCDSKLRPDCFTMDYKLPSSGMEDMMVLKNFDLLCKNDCVKFVIGSHDDLKRALEVIEKYNLCERCHVYFSPVFGSIESSEIVDFMISHTLNGVNMQLQMHKFIWDPDKRGV